MSRSDGTRRFSLRRPRLRGASRCVGADLVVGITFIDMRPRYRLRLRVRRHLPRRLINLGLAAKGARDCGAHGWYNAGDHVERCYYCLVGQRPYDPAHFPSTGCAFCLDEGNRPYHLEPLADHVESSEQLMRCPQCSSLWELPAFGREDEILSLDEARERYPDAALDRR